MGEARRRKLAGDTEPRTKKPHKREIRRRIIGSTYVGDSFLSMMALMMATRRIRKFPR